MMGSNFAPHFHFWSKMNQAKLLQLAVENEKQKNWYSVARRNIKKLAKVHQIDFNQLCGVVAITSQNIRLEFNMQLVLEWIQNGANCDAADLVRHYSIVKRNLKHFLETGEIRGPKVSAFYQALIGNEEAIVLDTHMASAFHGGTVWKPKSRRVAEKSIKNIAKKTGWTNSQVQAAIWCGIYRTKNPNKKKVANFFFHQIGGQQA